MATRVSYEDNTTRSGKFGRVFVTSFKMAEMVKAKDTAFFAGLIVVKAKFLKSAGCTEYLVWCDSFEEVTGSIPVYEKIEGVWKRIVRK